jgi:phosphocarrier protein HPr
MPSSTVVVGSTVGLHARPAAVIAQAASEFPVPVTLATDGGVGVDAGSALMIMTLGAKCGDSVTVESEDADAVARISELVLTDLDA